MADDKEVAVKITGDASSVKQTMTEAQAAVKAAADNMRGSMGGMVDILGKVKGGFLALTAIVAGAGMFDKAIAETQKITGEAKGLAKAFGVTATEASVWRVAMANVGADADGAKGAIGALTRTLIQTPEKFAELGVATKDASGAFRPMSDILLDVNSKFSTMADGTGKNIAMQAIFGKQWQSIGPILALTSKGMKDAKDEAEKLGLVVGQENVEAGMKYKQAMTGMKAILEGLAKAVGDAVMPVMTALANWFREIGPAAVTIMKGAIGGLVTTFWILKSGVDVLWETFISLGNVVGIVANGIASVVGAISSGDWAGAKRAVVDAMRGIADEGGAYLDRMAAKVASNNEKIKNLFSAPTATKLKGGDEAPDLSKGAKDDKDLAALRLGLAKATAEAKYAQEKDALTRSQSLYDAAYSQNKISIQEYYAASLAITQAGLARERQMKETEIAATSKQLAASQAKGTPEGEKETLKFRIELVKLTSDLTLIEGRQATAAIDNAQKRAQAEEALANKLATADIDAREKASLAVVALDQQDANFRASMMLTTQAQLIEQERAFEDRKYDIARAAIAERLDLEKNGPRDPVAIDKLNKEIEALEAQHQLAMTANTQKATIERVKDQQDAMNSIQSSFQSGFASMLNATQSFAGFFKGVMSSILGAVTTLIAKKVTAWVFGEHAMSAATVAGNLTRVTSDWWAAAQGVAASAWAAVKTIAMKAWEVAASVYSAIAGIPYVGPFLAPVMAVAAGATVMGFAAHVASAEGGYDIPAGVNPMTQLHEREMVLPAKQADAVRDMANGNGGGGSPVNITIHAIDAKGVSQLFMDHGGALVKSLKSQSRNFAF